MKLDDHQQSLLRMLPGVDRILELAKKEPFGENIPKKVQVQAVRDVVTDLRNAILDNNPEMSEDSLSEAMILGRVKARTQAAMAPNLKRVINATGVVVHTNLGRSLLASDAIENLTLLASRYSNLEFDLSEGRRGSRYSCVEPLLCEITGAEAAMVVNNNAGAVLLSLETIASGKKAIVSRGELVEIGGSFRIPDVMAKSGAILKEVGTTNRTHLRDYQNTIDADTGLLLKVHTSNYSVVGFTASVSLKELVELGEAHQIPVMEDLGSGTFVDFSAYGIRKEPTVQESVATGADIVTFSGDKLLGGPQAGIIVGKADMIARIRQNPINRALRIDKLTLAALESTLRLYRDMDKAVTQIPTLRMLTCPLHEIERKAEQLHQLLTELGDSRADTELLDLSSRVGGGALPLQELPSKCVGIRIRGISANAIERAMRENTPPIIGRIEEDLFIMDLRTTETDELPIIQIAFGNLLNRGMS